MICSYTKKKEKKEEEEQEEGRGCCRLRPSLSLSTRFQIETGDVIFPNKYFVIIIVIERSFVFEEEKK